MRTIANEAALFSVVLEYRGFEPNALIFLEDSLDLPDNSVITSFAVQTDGTWRIGQLREFVATKLPQQEGPQNRPWVSLNWQKDASIQLEVPVFPAKEPVQVRYEIWARGERTAKGLRWKYCCADTKSDPGFSLVAASPELHVRTDPDNPEFGFVIEKSLPAPTRLTARYGRYQLKDVWWWRIESSWPLFLPASNLPRPGHLVFVLDASRSQTKNAGLWPQLQIVKTLVSLTPRASVELILVNRAAKAQLGRFVRGSDLDPTALGALATLPLANGSFLEKGLELASQALVALGKPGTIIVMTDGELRSRFSPGSVVAALERAPKGTVVHWVNPTTGSNDHIERHADHLASQFDAEAFSVTVGARRSSTSPSLKQLLSAALFGAAVKPSTWYALTLEDASRPESPTWPRTQFDGPGSYSFLDAITRLRCRDSIYANHVVPAGERLVWSGFTREPPPTRLSLSGQTAGRTIQITLEPDQGFEALLPRLANSESGTITCLSEAKHQERAKKDGFLAPGLEFWVPGTTNDEVLMVSYGGSNPCERADVHSGTAPDPPHAPPAELLTAPLKSCGFAASAQAGVKATVEIGPDEILDVAVEGRNTEDRTCVENALWATQLAPDPGRWGRATYTIYFARTK